MFGLGLMMAQVMVPNQAASMAMISPASMGRASTFFNTMRQVGSATGVAVLSTVLIAVSSSSGGSASHTTLSAYRWAFLTAAGFAVLAIPLSLSIHDSDASETIVRRGHHGEKASASGPDTELAPDAVRESVA
jgi:MFS family permease